MLPYTYNVYTQFSSDDFSVSQQIYHFNTFSLHYKYQIAFNKSVDKIMLF